MRAQASPAPGTPGRRICLHLADALLQGGQVIAGPGNVVAAPKVHPLHFGQQVPERCLHRVQGHSQGIGVLLAEGVEVEAVQQAGSSGWAATAASHWARVVPRRLPGAQGS